MFKFLHAADIHLDSPLQGLERYDGAPVDEIRGATRRALENLVELALGQPVDFVLISGDLYDGDWKDANTGLFFVAQMRRLREANIPVILIAGNHDAANKMTSRCLCRRTLNCSLIGGLKRLSHHDCLNWASQSTGVRSLTPPRPTIWFANTRSAAPGCSTSVCCIPP